MTAHASHHLQMVDEDIAPRWALSLEPIPDNFLPLEQKVVDVIKANAKRLITVLAECMADKSAIQHTKGQAYMTAL